MVDKPTMERLMKLHPLHRAEVINIIERINTVVLTGPAKVRITQGLRTWDEQDALYSQGRDTLDVVNAKRKKAGMGGITIAENRRKVTNAKAGSSWHNYGLAVDIVLIINRREASWDTKKDWDKDGQSDWMEVVHEFKSNGWKWGGDWVSFKDMPHFEKTFGLKIVDAKIKHNKKDFIKDTLYIKI